jgi:hypothetical protein
MQVAIHVQVLDNLNKKFLDAAKGSFSEYVQVYYFMTGMSCVGVRCVGVVGCVGGICVTLLTNFIS